MHALTIKWGRCPSKKPPRGSAGGKCASTPHGGSHGPLPKQPVHTPQWSRVLQGLSPQRGRRCEWPCCAAKPACPKPGALYFSITKSAVCDCGRRPTPRPRLRGQVCGMLGHQHVTPVVAPAIHIHGQMREEGGGSQWEVSGASHGGGVCLLSSHPKRNV